MSVNAFQRQDVQTESIDSRCDRYLRMFDLTQNELRTLRETFNGECRQALRHHKNPINYEPATLKFLDTCVDRPPVGKEAGVFYAIDFGGTNLRTVRVELDGRGGYSMKQNSENIREKHVSDDLPKGLMDPKATASMLFDALAMGVRKLMEAEGDLAERGDHIFGVGFTFSFPMQQSSINSGWCPFWTKGFETGNATDDPVAGGQADICQLLQAAFDRNDVPANCAAALNDTTGTLLSCAYTSYRVKTPPCVVGVILGTGMNAAYYERTAKESGYQGYIINTELGGFNSGLPRNIIDLQVDYADAQPGVNVMEKMCSSLFIPEITRRALLRMFAWEAPDLAWVRYALTTEACMAAAYDSSPDRQAVREVLSVQLEWDVEDLKTLDVVRQLCRRVLQRSARLLAMTIAALAKQTGKLQFAAGGVTVGVDGSVYTKNQPFQKDVREALGLILGESIASLITMKVSSDGSGLGAAILAACEMQKSNGGY